MCEISSKNSERLLRKWQITLGDTFLPHTVFATKFIYFNHVLKSFKSITKIKNFKKYFKEGVLKYFKIP